MRNCFTPIAAARGQLALSATCKRRAMQSSSGSSATSVTIPTNGPGRRHRPLSASSVSSRPWHRPERQSCVRDDSGRGRARCLHSSSSISNSMSADEFFASHWCACCCDVVMELADERNGSSGWRKGVGFDAQKRRLVTGPRKTALRRKLLVCTFPRARVRPPSARI